MRTIIVTIAAALALVGSAAPAQARPSGVCKHATDHSSGIEAELSYEGYVSCAFARRWASRVLNYDHPPRRLRVYSPTTHKHYALRRTYYVVHVGRDGTTHVMYGYAGHGTGGRFDLDLEAWF